MALGPFLLLLPFDYHCSEINDKASMRCDPGGHILGVGLERPLLLVNDQDAIICLTGNLCNFIENTVSAFNDFVECRYKHKKAIQQWLLEAAVLNAKKGWAHTLLSTK